MRLIDADSLGVGRCNKDVLPAAYCAGWNGLIGLIENAPIVDAVPAEKYDALREAFIDYVCSGVSNPAPYCKNRCAECVDGYGWCRNNGDNCAGFDPDKEG